MSLFTLNIFKSHFDPFDSCFFPVLIRPAQCAERERPWCARIKRVGNQNEIKKLVTKERIAGKVSLFGYMFYASTSITGANLGRFERPNLMHWPLKKNFKKKITTLRQFFLQFETHHSKEKKILYLFVIFLFFYMIRVTHAAI